MRKMKRSYTVYNVPEKRLLAILHTAVWERVTKGRAGMRWNSVVGKV